MSQQRFEQRRQQFRQSLQRLREAPKYAQPHTTEPLKNG
jgi:hypothetical protein